MSLIVVTNRAPYNIKIINDAKVYEKTSGGLVSALEPVMNEKKGIWVCASENNFKKEINNFTFTIEEIKLTKTENKHYYEGFCNTQIWPLFHYFPARYKFQLKDWECYQLINQRFADKIISILKPEDKIWIHDYQLFLVPQMLRAKGVTNKIGFFLHIPFPNIEVYRIFPKRLEILESLMHCNLIGFHTDSYKKHFLGCVNYFLNENITKKDDLIYYNGNQVKVEALPISIDFNKVNTIAHTPEIEAKVNELKKTFENQAVGLLSSRNR